MKIAGCVFQKRCIANSTPSEFITSYKGCQIHVYSRHGFGYPNDDKLTRFNIEVYGDNGYIVNTWEDFSTINEAIESALVGAKLAKKK